MSNISGTKAQAVLVVQNAAHQDVHIEKGRVIFESASGGDVWCAPSNLAAGATAGCYAPSVLALHCNVTTQATTELTLLGRKDRTTKGGEYVPC
ncbi:hypothetical protein ACFWPV_36830 [Streptomyces uncialis]|uniref:hypothetical protein n=1 Tax=Streptomyces uncialis TaxID=1048205 RepID=UPI003669B33B